MADASHVQNIIVTCASVLDTAPFALPSQDGAWIQDLMDRSQRHAFVPYLIQKQLCCVRVGQANLL